MINLGVGSFARTLALTMLSAAVTVLAVVALTGSGLGPQQAVGLGGLLECTARWSLLAAGIWSTTVLALVLRAHATGRLGRLPCPRSWRPLVAAICGLGAATLVALPATATAAAGAPQAPLPSLGRPHGAPPHSADSDIQPRSHARILVRPGDSLWSIVVRRHPGEPAAATARRVGQLHRANRRLIGPDADLIRPGQRLVADDHDPETAR